MQRLLLKSGATVVLLVLGGCFLWYGLLTNRIAAEDRNFVKNHQSARLFPETWYWLGEDSYYTRKNPAEAVEKYRAAISRQPLFIDAWLELIKAQLRLGHVSEARRLFLVLAPELTRTSYWKWKELLLSYDLKEGAFFEEAFNSILERSPDQIGDACKIGILQWKGWGGVLSHTIPENRAALMKPVLDSGSVENTLSLWEELKGDGEFKDKNLLLRACDFLLENGKIRQAKEMWNAWLGREQFGIYDGEFESAPTNAGFGWRICEHPLVKTAYSSIDRHSKGRSLHFRFIGTENISYSHVSQIVPVKPGTSYVLTFARKSRSIESDQGVFLKVSGFKCEAPQTPSTPLTGTNPWAVEKMKISVPDNCEAILVQVCRQESRKLDNIISGDYWLDEIALHED